MALTLNLAITTHTPEGIKRVAEMNLPQVDGVNYVVSWQNHQDAPVPPEILERQDIEIYRFNEKGLSRNRNNAISKCKGDIILFADDDVEYSAEGLRTVIDIFKQNPNVDVATFKSSDRPGRIYPKTITLLKRKLPKGYYVCSIEIALRRSTAGYLRCHPELGLGAPKLRSGEDEIFLHTAINHKLNCCFFPEIICNHQAVSTGERPSVASLRGAGCVIALKYPWSCVLRLPLKAWRVSHVSDVSFVKALLSLAQGAFYAPGVYLRGKQYL